jgi:3-hydroxyacyl-[acyl-carrier-protein] dehydratase
MAGMSIQEIMNILPHRYPMLMVDRIIECENDTHIIGIKNLSINEPFFQGHFPLSPIMPGVLQIEAMAQVGGILLSKKTGVKGNIPLLMSVDRAKFRKPVIPGDQLKIEIDVLSSRKQIIRCAGKATVDNKSAAEAELMFMFTEKRF